MPNQKNIYQQFLELLSEKTGQIFDANALAKFCSTISLTVAQNFWGEVAQISAALKFRLVTIWAQDLTTVFELNACLELEGKYLLLRTTIAALNPAIQSFTPYFPAADRLERHTHDMFGIFFSDHPDHRRWTKHQAWHEKIFPLCKNFPVSTMFATTTPPDNNYQFLSASGSGTCAIPVGPVHAGIIEPGHFRFQVAGEDIINLEERLGYLHKGIEKIAEGRDVFELLKLAARVSGDSTISHSWAAAMALENAVNLDISARANYIRAIMCESERIANHLGDFAAICNDVAYTFAYFQLMRLKELWLRLNKEVFGSRLLMDAIIPGGVKSDLMPNHLNLICDQIKYLRKELVDLYPIIEANTGLHDRLKNTGILTTDAAKKLGVLGFVGKASGLKFDVRHDAAYFPYNKCSVYIPTHKKGDVLARARVRAQEILISFDLIEKFIKQLPDGEIRHKWPVNTTAVEGIGIVEGWRGEIFTFVRIGSDGLIERFFPRDPSWFSWPALEKLIHGNIVPDFPVCNKSINGSYAGVDL
ncbi:MAG: NADH-quinone oxidoreductase subunit C [Gammaproteobacteria bacterium]|nr:NADH-quinone oxidoreductase subunit C [Gammaproteobacteria bacterium]